MAGVGVVALVLGWVVVNALLLRAAFTIGHAGVVRAHGRGYSSAWTSFAVSVVTVVAATTVVVLLVRIHEAGVVLAGPGATFVVGASIAWSATLVLPAKGGRRTAGMRPRRFHYLRWCFVVGGLSAAVVVLTFSAQDPVGSLGYAAPGTAVVGQLLWHERRYRTQAAHYRSRPFGHALYLRPFVTEGRADFHLPYARARRSFTARHQWVDLDEFLIRGALPGDFVALGNPSERLPPGGALRVYLTDQGWKAELAELAGDARQILMVPGVTEAMREELRVIADHGLQARLVIVTPPRHRGVRQRLILPITDRLKGWHVPSWPEFADELRAAGFQVAFDDLGPGAVVGFDADGAAAVLATDLVDPADFVAAILSHCVDGAPAVPTAAGLLLEARRPR